MPKDDTALITDDTNVEIEGGQDTGLLDSAIEDVASGKRLKETPKEIVRQRVERTLMNEYGLAPDDMTIDFLIRGGAAGGKMKKADIAVFHPGTAHGLDNLSRIVVCKPEPKQTGRTVRIRDHEQAKTDLLELEGMMDVAPACHYGLWTNGLEYYYIQKEARRFEILYRPVGDWPLAGGSDEDLPPRPPLRPADPEMLKTAFRRCHNFIHGNEGMPKDAAFWQFLYLIFCKLYDEEQAKSRKAETRFFASPRELFTDEGRKAIRARITSLFEEVKEKYSNIFRGNEEITLSDRALEFMVAELAKYDFGRTGMDAKGAAYQEIVGNNLRGDRGQYFTPRGVVKLAVDILDPKPEERVLDPACGTGGFLVTTLDYLRKRFDRDANVTQETASTEDYLPVQTRLRQYAEKNLFGCDFDPFLIRASQMNMVMAGDGRGHLYHINSLEFPRGHLADLTTAARDIPFDSMDVVLTNPPFGSDIPVTDPQILQQYELARNWEPAPGGGYRLLGGGTKSSVAPEILFIERCIKWLRPGGRMGIVLPNGILGNPAAEYIRAWVLRNCYVLASIDLPVEVFIVEANVNVLTSLLFLKKKTDEERSADALTGAEYPIFMAVAEKVGFDRRGKTLYKRLPNGDEIWEEKTETETRRIGDRVIRRDIKKRERVKDDDLPVIATRYHAFRERYPEPGGAA